MVQVDREFEVEGKMKRICGRKGFPSRTASYCGHCGEYLSSSQYAKHKRIYFDESTKTWRKQRNGPAASTSFSVRDPFESDDSSGDENMAEGFVAGGGKS